MFTGCGNNGIADSGSSKIDYGPKDGGICTTRGSNCFRTKGGSLAIPQKNAEISVCLAGTRRRGIKTTAIVNPAMFLSTEKPTESLEHDCLLTVEQVYSSRSDLKDESLENPDLELFTDGSSFVRKGRRMAGYAVVTTTKVLKSGTLPANTSAQKAELVALK